MIISNLDSSFLSVNSIAYDRITLAATIGIILATFNYFDSKKVHQEQMSVYRNKLKI